jgi:hypothetical protein
MSKKPETLFSNQLIKNLNQVFFTRIENKHGGGVPDLYCTYNNKSAFLELKIKTKQNKVIISPLQISWNFKHFQQNPINYYLVKDPRREVIELYDGEQRAGTLGKRRRSRRDTNLFHRSMELINNLFIFLTVVKIQLDLHLVS